MSTKISGRNFDVSILDEMIHVKSASATISDESAVAMTRGITNGYTEGMATCEVEYEVDLSEFKKIQNAARKAGSFRGIDVHDALFYANTGYDEDKIELFGVKLVISDLINVDPESADKTTRKLTGFVTSPNFVRINGIPYLSASDTRGIV